MCYLEVVAYGATVVGTLIAIATLVYTILTYRRASRIELVISQRKELFNALTGLHHYVSSLRNRSDDYVESKAFKTTVVTV